MACFGPLATTVSAAAGASAIAAYWVAVLGDLTALVVYLSPLVSLWGIWQDQSVEERRAAPCVAGVLNSTLWFLYGLPEVHPHSTVMLSLNCFGVLTMAIYLVIFLYFCHEERRWLLCYLLVFEVMILVLLGALVFTQAPEAEDKARVLGFCAVVSACGMYAIPVLDIISVCKSKNVESAPMSLLVTGPSLLNAIVWTVYSSISMNLFVLIPNAIGVLMPLVQLSIYHYFAKKAKAAGNAAQGN